MAIEHACTRVVSKPWGSTDLLPWSDIQPGRRRDRRTLVSASRCERASLGPAAQAAVHQRAAVDSGSSGRCVRAFDRSGERQDRGLVHPVRDARGQSCRRAEAAAHGSAIARLDRGWLDRGPDPMASGPEGRCRLRPGRHHSCHRPGTRDGRNPAAKRHDVPPFRSWPAARNPRGQRRGGGECGAGRMSISSEPSDRCQIPARRQPAFRS